MRNYVRYESSYLRPFLTATAIALVAFAVCYFLQPAPAFIAIKFEVPYGYDLKAVEEGVDKDGETCFLGFVQNRADEGRHRTHWNSDGKFQSFLRHVEIKEIEAERQAEMVAEAPLSCEASFQNDEETASNGEVTCPFQVKRISMLRAQKNAPSLFSCRCRQLGLVIFPNQRLASSQRLDCRWMPTEIDEIEAPGFDCSGCSDSEKRHGSMSITPIFIE